MQQINKEAKIAVIGGGSWATALVKILCDNQADVSWWMRNEEAVTHIRAFGRNPHYLSSAEINISKDRVSTDIKATIAAADIIIFAVPAAFLHTSLSSLSPADFAGKFICSAIKGIVPEFNLIIGEYFNSYFNTNNQYRIMQNWIIIFFGLRNQLYFIKNQKPARNRRLLKIR